MHPWELKASLNFSPGPPLYGWDKRGSCFDAKNFGARNFDARNIDARNWMKLIPGRWDKRGPYFLPTSLPDRQSHTSRHHHHNNLRIFRVNIIKEYSGSTISKNILSQQNLNLG